MGLKFGMYSSAGFLTCGRYAASLGKEQQDADTWASWGVDYIKYDNCTSLLLPGRLALISLKVIMVAKRALRC